MNYIKDNFLNIVVLVLVSILFVERCGYKPEIKQEPTIVRDTVYSVRDTTIYSKPQIIKTIEIHKDSTKSYIPDTNYNKLVIQYQTIVNQLLAKNIQQDSIKIDSIGYVKITDTVQKNLIIGRSSQVNVKYPTIRETITLPYIPKNQLYIGGGIQLGPTNQLNGGILLKTRKIKYLGAL